MQNKTSPWTFMMGQLMGKYGTEPVEIKVGETTLKHNPSNKGGQPTPTAPPRSNPMNPPLMDPQGTPLSYEDRSILNRQQLGPAPMRRINEANGGLQYTDPTQMQML